MCCLARILLQKHEAIGDVRGTGLMVGVELVRNKAAKAPAPATGAALASSRVRSFLEVPQVLWTHHFLEQWTGH